MFQYKKYFDDYCEENKLSLSLSYTMPCGYETAFGTFDSNSLTVFINKNLLKDREEFEQAFYLFHELRHAVQYINPQSLTILLMKAYRISLCTMVHAINGLEINTIITKLMAMRNF